MSQNVSITIGKGQGVTQAIVSKLKSENVSLNKIDASVWGQVLDKVKQDSQTQNKFKNASTKVENNDFKGWNVSTGQKLSISATTFADIKNLLLKASKEEDDKSTPKADSSARSDNLPDGAGNNVDKGRQVHAPEKKLVDGKEVNVTQNNGKYYILNDDNTQGEELVQDARTGNFKTRSQFIKERTAVADKFQNALNSGSAEVGNADDLANALFVKYNKDDSGNISREDFFNTELADMEQAGIQLTDAQKQNLKGMSSLAFNVIDKDGDGEITEAEYKAYLQEADINKDGSITSEEFSQYTDKAFNRNDARDQNALLGESLNEEAPSTPLDMKEQKTKWEQSPATKLVLGTTSKLDLSGLNLGGTTQTDAKDPLYAGNYNNQLMTNAGVSKDEIKQALDLFKKDGDIDTITSGTQKKATITIGGKEFTVIQTQGNIGVFSPDNLTQPIYLATYTPKNIQNSDSQLDQTRLSRGYGLNSAPSTTASTPTTPPPAPHSGSGETNPYMKTGSFSQSNTSEVGGQYWTKKSPYEE